MGFFGHDSRIRVIGQRLFYQFGLHCATHQIRLILVSAVVITSLFYPALAIYSSSQPQYLAQISSRILQSVAGEGLSSHASYHDLHDPWSGYDTLHIREDSVARARCGTEGILRVERLLIHSALDEDAGALNNQILLSTLQIERRLSRTASIGKGCLRRNDGTCFVLSPVAFWNYDEGMLFSDSDMLDTLQRSSNISLQGIPVTPQMVLAGRELDDRSNLDFAMFLVLTYVFHETSCLGSGGHSAWIKAVQQTVGGLGDLTVQIKEPTLLALEYKGSKDTRSSALYTFTWLTYFVLLIYGHRMFRRINKLHSRVGVALTGAVEILVSTVTSLSVCALAGFKITMIPWEFFPVLIMFVGMENMFALVDAIYSTPITLPVKDRVAKGLSRAGTSNTLKCCAYNSILGVIAGLSGGAIRQFCAFAVVVLVAHWFLVHTFFVTVLSIDLQRLELDELLQQAPDVTESDSESRGSSKVAATQNLKGRVNKNVTLLLLLAITGILYYSTKRAGVSDTRSSLSRGALSRGKYDTEVAPAHSPASGIWKLFNPNDDPLVHLRMEAPTILMLRPGMTQSTDPRNNQRSRFPVRTIRRLMWLFKIFLAPILTTVGLLYGLLLYLLRGAQLLDARHDQPNDGTSECANTEPPVDEDVFFTTLPRAFPTDVEFIAASDDGRCIAAVGTQNEFVIWNLGENGHHSYVATDAADFLMQTSGSSSSQATITMLTLSGDGSMCAIGTGAGTVLAWCLGESGAVTVPQLSTERSSFSVTGLRFSVTRSSKGPLRLLATYDNGVALEWWTDSSGFSREITPSRPALVSRCCIVQPSATTEPAVAFFMEDGTLELCGAFQEIYPTPDFCVAAGNPSDHVSQVHASEILIGGQTRSIVAAATKAGVISVWDWKTGECITILDDLFGETSGLRLSNVKPKTCQFCGETVFESFLLSFSIGQSVVVYRAYLMEGSTRKCSCPQNQPQRALNPGVDYPSLKRKRSRQSSVASSGASSPRQTRSRNPSLSGTTVVSGVLPTFPVSGHGVHSRKVSEKDKDSLRRAVELMVLPIPSVENEDAEKSPPRTYTSLMAGRSHIWENLVAVRVAVTNFDRGRWEIIDEKVVGLRRKALTAGRPSKKWGVQLKPSSVSGLSPASLERWELWAFDPFIGRTQASSLASLKQEDQDDALMDPSKFKTAFSAQSGIILQESIPRLPFTRISSFLCRGNRCLAGFGNTIGVLMWKPPQILQRKPSLS